jgi:hypothetical protein
MSGRATSETIAASPASINAIKKNTSAVAVLPVTMSASMGPVSPENEPSKDDLFEQVEEWRADFDDGWFVGFAWSVAVGFLTAIVVILLALLMR